MKLGMPTLIELNTLEENVKLCKLLGLDFVEINMNLPFFQSDRIMASELRRLQKAYDVDFTFHLPEDIDIAHLNDKVRAVNHQIVLETLELMMAVECNKLNMHMNNGIYFKLPQEKIFLYEKFNDAYMENINAFRQQVSHLIKGIHMKVCIENTGIFHKNYLVKAVDHILDSECFALTWDIGHDYSSGHLDAPFMLERLHRIDHFHIHDAIGEKNHLELFTGEIQIQDFLNLIHEKGASAVIETKSKDALERSVQALKKRGLL